MTRHIVLGNQQLLVNIDRWLQVRDIFFPHVGQHNHLVGHAHKIAILEEDRVSWLNHNDWQRHLDYEEDALVTDNIAENPHLGLTLGLRETVSAKQNVFLREITVRNDTDAERKLRLAVHHDFLLYSDGIGDTAFYSPEADAVVHYKRAVYFLTGFCDDKGRSLMSDYAIGESVTPLWKMPDAHIHQGSVDSVIATDLLLKPNESKTVCYYLLASGDIESVHALQQRFLSEGYADDIAKTRTHHRSLLKQIRPDLTQLPKRSRQLYRRSILTILTQMDREGAITAANDTDNMQFNRDTYSYMWPRDGALVAMSLIRAGLSHLTVPFFHFCRDVLTQEGCLLHKYNPDRTLGSSWHPWIYDGRISLPIQEDETALVLHALWVYYETTRDAQLIRDLYKPLIHPAGEFLRRYRYGNGLPMESYDLWEQFRGIFCFTTATVLAGLRAAERLGHVYHDEDFCDKCAKVHQKTKDAFLEYFWREDEGYFRRRVSLEHGTLHYDDTLDASVALLPEFGVLDDDDPRLESTMRRIKEWLWVQTPIGGIARYLGDPYHRVTDDPAAPGNPWLITTLWYAKWLIRRARTSDDLDEALKLIQWCEDRALSTGLFPEQFHPHTGEPLSVAPLTWSHAEYVDTCTQYIDRCLVIKKRRKVAVRA